MFSRQEGLVDQPVTLPCGRCVGCRLEKSKAWAVRVMHEASLYEGLGPVLRGNCFLTLTYDDKHLPKDLSVNPDHVVGFMKRLRKRHGEGIRSYGCAEYGELCRNCRCRKRRPFEQWRKGVCDCEHYIPGPGRPHYHLCLFNHQFSDAKFWRKSPGGGSLSTSSELSELWPFGFHTIGSLTFESAAYVARYVTKKMNGDRAKEHYEVFDPDTGELFDIKPERAVCVSRGTKSLGTGGIGRGWLERFRGDVYPCDEVLLRGLKLRPPKYYDYRFDIDFPEECANVKKLRQEKFLEWQERNAEVRPEVAEQILVDRTKELHRRYENGSDENV